jgi:tetratricopeptide (TPR) repeat protein
VAVSTDDALPCDPLSWRWIGRIKACSQCFGSLWHLRKDLVRINFQSVACAVILGLFLHAAGQHAEAQKPSSTNPQQEERGLLQAAKREPNNYQVVGSVGQYYLHREKWRESVLWLTKAYALSGGDAATGYDLAFALMQAGDLEGAKRQIGQVLTRADAAKLHNLLGEVEGRSGDLVDAAREYHRAAELEPSESNIFDLATFLLQHKKYVGSLDDSIKFFRYGVAQFPRSSQMMVGLGVALYADNEYDEAVHVLCAAVDLDPKDRRPIQFLGRASRVSPQLAQEVDLRLRDFVQRFPENAATNYFYALGLWERGGGDQGKDLVKIEQLLRKAESLSPEWYEPHYQLGVVYEAEKRYGDAIGEMKRAVKIDPDFFPAHFRLAVLYNRMGQRAEASTEAAAVKRLKENEIEGEAAHDVTR